MKIKGLKKAVGEYKRANAGGAYSLIYGYLMFDKETGNLWTDEFYCIGQSDWKEYRSESVVNLGNLMQQRGIEVNMKNVKDFISCIA